VACAREFVAERLGERPGVPGRRSLLGNMPDWNPAEMIGAAPRPLALSLYQRLVGDRAWSRARARMGYRDLQPEPLIVAVGGRPYVDVRASLASFLPASLDDATAGRWIDACVDRIAAEPHLHDKVEFEVTPTCLAFDWPDHAARMRAAGLDEAGIERFRDGLRAITAAQLEGGDAAVRRELAALDLLTTGRGLALARPAQGAPALGRAIRDHLERCETAGVEPFAVLARQAFIALALLRSLVGRGVLTDAEASLILRSIPSVASETAAAIDACAGSPPAIADFVARFGHLRSNSYEITAPDYAASLDRVLGDGAARAGHAARVAPRAAEAIVARHAPAIEGLLAAAGLPGDALSLLAFVRAAVAARERAKFEFMKDLDLVLETGAAFGAAIGLGRDDLSFLRIEELLAFATNSLTGATAARLRRTAGGARKQALLTAALRLPDLIREPDEVLAFRQARGKPNFVTARRVVARAVALDEVDAAAPALDGAIVLVRAADPGYDWIFSHPIAGLVTEYGGMGSHMAIRAAEFDLPAAIGCGGAIYEELLGAPAVDLDCANGRVRPAPGAS
jgi:phosphohistidine swiveling domain-containing protein